MNTHFNKNQFWLKHIEGYKKSNLSMPNYCQRESINVRTFQYWLYKNKRNESKSQLRQVSQVTKESPFLPIIINSQKDSKNPQFPKLNQSSLPEPQWLASFIKSLHQEFL